MRDKNELIIHVMHGYDSLEAPKEYGMMLQRSKKKRKVIKKGK